MTLREEAVVALDEAVRLSHVYEAAIKDGKPLDGPEYQAWRAAAVHARELAELVALGVGVVGWR